MEHYVNFKEELQQRTAYAEEVIRKWLPVEEGFALTMAQAMNYSMCAGGKRLRPILLLETFRLFGGEGSCGAFYGRYRDDSHAFADP